MPKLTIRLAARLYPKGQERAEFIESTESDLHYASEVGVSTREIERGAIRQALVYGWRHPRIGALVATVGLLFSAWLGLMSNYDFKIFGFSSALWLMHSWVIAVVVSRYSRGALSKLAVVSWAFVAIAYFVHFKEWRFGGIAEACVDGRLNSYCQETTWGTRTDLSQIVFPLLIAAGAAYLWLGLRMIQKRALLRGALAIAFMPLQVITYFMMHQGFGTTSRDAALIANFGPIILSAATWMILIASAIWQVRNSKGEATQPQR